MKKRKKTIKVRIEIFQENKRERNLKAINCQKWLYANQQKFLLFKWSPFHISHFSSINEKQAMLEINSSFHLN